ncbi:MAG: hypothetical protein LBH96_00895 [Candidatus Peribacteria bacterium]|nr:hypothetical protein [Candidatus Peribacteria bacterium]
MKDNLRQVEDFFMELDGFIGQISLNDFSLRGLNQHIFSTTLELLQTKEKELLSMKTSKEHLSKQIQDIAHQMRQQEQEQQKHSEEIRILETKIRHIDAEKIELLKKEKSDLYAQQIHLEEGLSFEIFSSFTKQASIKHLLGEVSV